VPRLVHILSKGFDVVCGWRYERNDPFFIKLKSKLGNFLQRAMTGLPLHDISCSLRAYRKAAVEGIVFTMRYDFCLLPYILVCGNPLLRVAEVKIKGSARRFGCSRYNYWSIFFGTIASYP
jgi:hypothetical protein